MFVIYIYLYRRSLRVHRPGIIADLRQEPTVLKALQRNLQGLFTIGCYKEIPLRMSKGDQYSSKCDFRRKRATLERQV